MSKKKKLTEKQAMEIAFSKIKPSLIGNKKYNTLRRYMPKYENGTLNKTAIENLLKYFGFSSECVYTYSKDNDQSIKNKE